MQRSASLDEAQGVLDGRPEPPEPKPAVNETEGRRGKLTLAAIRRRSPEELLSLEGG